VCFACNERGHMSRDCLSVGLCCCLLSSLSLCLELTIACSVSVQKPRRERDAGEKTRTGDAVTEAIAAESGEVADSTVIGLSHAVCLCCVVFLWFLTNEPCRRRTHS
jgi:hypothetical protein